MENENKVIDNETNVEVANENKRKSKKTIVIGISVAILIVIGVAIAIILSMFSPSSKYNKANTLIDDGKYDEAIAVYQELGDYEDSSQKIIECNRRKLYDYITENGAIEQKDYDGSSYGITTEGENLKFYNYSHDNPTSTVSADVEFEILIDMTSNEGKFFTSYGFYTGFRSEESTGEGKFDITKFSSNHNGLSLDEYSGTIGRSMILDMSNTWGQLLCHKINPLLGESELGLVAKDIGFTSIEK